MQKDQNYKDQSRRKRTGLIATLLAAVAIVGFAVDFLYQPHRFPLVSIEVNGTQNVQPNQIRQMIAESVPQNIFRIDLVAVAEAVEDVPWVANATVQRRWPPGTLHVNVNERVISAQWSDGLWIDEQGIPVEIPEFNNTDLPKFHGSASAGKEMLTNYQSWQPRLAEAGLEIRTLTRSDRGGWEASIARVGNESSKTDADHSEIESPKQLIQVRLGSSSPSENVERFTHIYQSVINRYSESVESIDMRHPDGLSVRWKDQRIPRRLESKKYINS